MKKFILLLLLPLFTLAQSDKLITIDNILTPYVAEFIEEANERKVPVMDTLLKNVDYIGIDIGMEYPMMGYYSRKHKIILIAEYVLVDSMLTKSVVFHEIGHAMNVKHSCDTCTDIMSGRDKNDALRYYYIEENWIKELNKFFEQIKQKE